VKPSFVGARGQASLQARLRPVLDRIGDELGIGNCALSVMLTDDAGIREYNRKFRSIDEPTDVLSFPSATGDDTASGHYLGDLVISLDRARVQAAEHGHGLEEEVEVLLLHGVLHLLGHDHEVDDGEMRALEQELAMKLFGSARGLIARAEGPDGAPR
jgi:probable rRNA maturation factor